MRTYRALMLSTYEKQQYNDMLGSKRIGEKNYNDKGVPLS